MRPILGFGLIIVSLFMLLGFFNADLGGSGMTALTALMVAVGIPGVAGGMILSQHIKERKRLSGSKEQLRRQTLEAETLFLAAERDGRLTVVELVQEFALTHEEAEGLLRSMVERGNADIEVTDSGLLVYTFPDVQRLGDKPESRGVLDA